MAEIKEAVAIVSENVAKSKSPPMDICSVPSVQRVVNFTKDDGKMLFGERFQGTTSEISTVCHLPLLFVDGVLSNLEELTIDQLETFVPHMIQCSLNSMPLGTQPKWWPSNIEFSSKPVKPPKMSYCEWFKRLKMLVSNCYTYHQCEFALNLGFDRSPHLTSLASPYAGMSVSNISSHLTASFYMGYERVKAERRGSKGNERCRDMQVSGYKCFKCDSKCKESQEIRNREKTCPKNQSSAISCLKEPLPTVKTFGLPPSKLSMSRSRVRSVQRSVFNNQSLLVNQRKRLYKRTSEENTPIPVTKENLTAAKWSPNVILHDCFKSTVGLKGKSGTGDLKILPLSSINGEGRKKLISRQDQHSAPLKRKRVAARNSILPVGYRKEANKRSPSENIDLFPSDDTFPWKETDSNKIVTDAFPESACDFQSNQASFMKCFGLIDASNFSLPCNRIKKPLGNPIRYSGVPVSSPLGNLIFNRSQIPVSVFLTKIEKVERYCSAKPVNIFFPSSNFLQSSTIWEVSWKKKNMVSWVHNYSYPLKKWWKTPLLWEKKVKRRNSYLNLLKQCKPCSVILRRLKIVDSKLRTPLSVITDKIKKESFQNTQRLSKEFSLIPEIKKLTDEEINAYTNSVSPVLKRLSLRQIKKYSK